MALVTKASFVPSGEVTKSSTRSGMVARARAPGVRSGCFSGSPSFFSTLAGFSGVARDGCRHVEREDRVAAFGGAVLHDVFPLLLVFILLLFAPGLARGEVDGLRIRGPGEGVDVFFSFRDRESFAAVRRDEIDLADFVFRVGVGIGVVALLGCVLPFREEGDPLAVGRPLGVGVVSGLR